MIFQDNVIKKYLSNVYFITGTPCGGKTTVAKALGEKHGIPVYDIDEMFELHRQMSDNAFQPNMNRQFKDADEFFGRSVNEYVSWLLGNTREQLDYVLLDLIRLSQGGRIICDCHLTLEEAEKITEPSKVVFLVREPHDLVDEYCSREDHKGFHDFIRSASNVEEAKAICNETLRTLNDERYNAIKSSNYFWLERSSERTAQDTVRLVEKHFGFDMLEGVTVEKVEKGSQTAKELLAFVESCSWTQAKEHIAEMIRSWSFTEWETMFAAIKDKKIIGMASLMKTDYYPLADICPWVSCIFVSEEYRGHRISEKLIANANEYAKALGFEKSYIPTEYIGLYERYGYRYLRDIVNYGSTTDRLFVKDLK